MVKQMMKQLLILIFFMAMIASGGHGGSFRENRPPGTPAKAFDSPSDSNLNRGLKQVPYVYTEWETFYVKDGLPNDHIFSIEADGDRLWVGTEDGLALYENGKWKSWREKDGLPWKVISDIEVSSKTGDIWLALFGGGLARFSGGRFDHFNQFNSGLVNDVVYGVALLGDTVWAATTAGISSYNTVTGEWEIYTEKNAPMEEIWCYNAAAGDGKVYIAVWGGGILEWDQKTRQWNAHRDPDREMEIDLYRDDGLIHIITTSASYIDGVLWASTYFGLSRYDGRHWRGYMDHDSGLASNFINFALGRSGVSCYNATDLGLAVLVDFESDTWVTYKKDKPTDKTWTAHVGIGNKEHYSVPTKLTLPNHFVICLDFQGDDLWIGTGHGLARGIGKDYYPGLRPLEPADASGGQGLFLKKPPLDPTKTFDKGR
jgi:ligand-binding sensor domain-containing protein